MENKRLLEIKCEADPQFAPAMYHNRIPLIRSLRLVSLCETELRDVRITVTFSPAFAAPYETLAALIEPHETVETAPVRITLLPEFLFSLTETVKVFQRKS